jgi:hypothetical protein
MGVSNAVQLYDHRGNAMTLRDVSALESKLSDQSGQLVYMHERLAELELAMEDQGWREIMGGEQRDFSRAALKKIMRLCRLMYLKNPLIRQGVNVQARYVWGRGVTVSGRDPRVNQVVQDFWDHPKNQAELTSHQARMLKEIDLQVQGNIFFVLFSDSIDSGATLARTIPPDEIAVVVSNPQDSKDPWFYRREWSEKTLNPDSGAEESKPRIAYYPDWGHNPAAKPKTLFGGKPVMWDTPVFHIKVGGLSDMSFGVPEPYAAIDWARAYKEFLEDWCTITRAYARFAWQMKTPGGARGVSSAKGRLATTLATGSNDTSVETNPAPTVGAAFIGSSDVDLKPMKTAGATTSADDGHRVLLMVAAVFGMPETFFGDADVGNHATSKTLDRPTELKFKDRQTLWAEVIRRILDFVVDRSAAATNGPLKGLMLVKNKAAGDEQDVPLSSDPKAGEEVDRYVGVSFPELLEHDVAAQVGAIVDAATLKGSAPAGTIDDKTLTRMLLTELGATNIDEIMDARDQIDETPVPAASRSAAAQEAALRKRAASELREAFSGFVKKYAAAA